MVVCVVSLLLVVLFYVELCGVMSFYMVLR